MLCNNVKTMTMQGYNTLSTVLAYREVGHSLNWRKVEEWMEIDRSFRCMWSRPQIIVKERDEIFSQYDNGIKSVIEGLGWKIESEEMDETDETSLGMCQWG